MKVYLLIVAIGISKQFSMNKDSFPQILNNLGNPPIDPNPKGPPKPSDHHDILDGDICLRDYQCISTCC